MNSTLLEWSDPLETIAPPLEMPDGGFSSFAAEAARARILLVEDQRDFRELLAELLTAEGYAVDCAANGREACLRLRRAPLPNLILLDLIMPVMNGWGFLSALQPDPALPRIPVYVLSGVR